MEVIRCLGTVPQASPQWILGSKQRLWELNNAESEMHKDLHEIIIFKKQTPKERERERT